MVSLVWLVAITASVWRFKMGKLVGPAVPDIPKSAPAQRARKTECCKFQKFPSGTCASPNRSIFTPMRSMIDRYMLHSLRLSSPAFV
jgi:hypothetical protein